MEQGFYSKTAGLYDMRHESQTTKRLRKLEGDAIRRFAKGVVLDAGCGTGAWLDRADVGIDISDEMLRIALEKHKPLVKGSVENTPFTAGAFDTILCMFAVLNLCNHEAAAREFSRLLKKGGHVILSVASVWDKGYSLREKLKLSKSDPDGRLVKTGTYKKFYVYGERLRLKLLNKKEIVESFEKNGFVLGHFDSAFVWQKPRWNNLEKFGPDDKIRLAIEKLLPYRDLGCIYVMAFRKTW